MEQFKDADQIKTEDKIKLSLEEEKEVILKTTEEAIDKLNNEESFKITYQLPDFDRTREGYDEAIQKDIPAMKDFEEFKVSLAKNPQTDDVVYYVIVENNATGEKEKYKTAFKGEVEAAIFRKTTGAVENGHGYCNFSNALKRNFHEEDSEYEDKIDYLNFINSRNKHLYSEQIEELKEKHNFNFD